MLSVCSTAKSEIFYLWTLISFEIIGNVYFMQNEINSNKNDFKRITLTLARFTILEKNSAGVIDTLVTLH